MTSTSNSMTHQGYAARIEYDDEDGIFVGHIAGIRDGVGFHADMVEGLRAAFHEAVEDYLETCARIGKEPQRAYSGQVMFRVDPEVHRRATLAAELAGKSPNQWAKDVLARAAAELVVSATPVILDPIAFPLRSCDPPGWPPRRRPAARRQIGR